MEATSIKPMISVKAIDQQLKAILAKDIRKIKDQHIKNAAFLQLIAV